MDKHILMACLIVMLILEYRIVHFLSFVEATIFMIMVIFIILDGKIIIGKIEHAISIELIISIPEVIRFVLNINGIRAAVSPSAV